MTLGVYWVLRESGLKVKRPKSKDRNGGNRGTLKGKSVLQALVSYASDSWCIIYTQPTVVVVQSLSCVWLSATSWTAAHQASLSFIISWSLRKLMSIESVIPSNYLILCHPLLLLPSVLASGFPMSQLFASCGQSIGAWAWVQSFQWIFSVDFL